MSISRQNDLSDDLTPCLPAYNTNPTTVTNYKTTSKLREDIKMTLSKHVIGEVLQGQG